MRATRDTIVELVDDIPDIPEWHPVTPIDDVWVLAASSLVCVAGRIVSVDENSRRVGLGNGSQSDVCNPVVRVGSRTIQFTAWEQQTAKLRELVTNKIYSFEALATKKGPGRSQRRTCNLDGRIRLT